MRNNIEISVLVFTIVSCHFAKNEAVSPPPPPSVNGEIFFADTHEPAAYKFGPGPGIITYTYPEYVRFNPQTDAINLRFRTKQQNSILLRIVNEFSNDYVDTYVHEGCIYFLYNAGSYRRFIPGQFLNITDNTEHLVKISRSNFELSLQIDNNKRTVIHRGYPQIVKDKIQIQIGGKLNENGIIESPFDGIIKDVVINGVRILDLVATGNNHSAVQGDVHLISNTYTSEDHNKLIKRSVRDHVVDDLVFSGSGNECLGDDEDECLSYPVTDSDNLVIPVYRGPTVSPVATKLPTKPNLSKLEPCDDEDCFGNGSGSGEGSGDYETTTSAVPEITEVSAVSKKWSTVNQPRQPQTTSVTFTTPPSTESLTTLDTKVTIPKSIEPETTEFTQLIYSTAETTFTEDLHTTTPRISSFSSHTEPPGPTSPSLSLENIAVIAGIATTVVIGIILAIIIINKNKSRKNEKATV